MSKPTTPTELLAQARASLNLARDDAKDAADAMPRGNPASRALRHLDSAVRNLHLVSEALRQPAAPPVVRLELTGQQVLDLARFVIPAWVLDAGEAEGLDENARQQLDVPVTVAVDPPTAPPGTWAWCSEYPEEGAVQLGGE